MNGGGTSGFDLPVCRMSDTHPPLQVTCVVHVVGRTERWAMPTREIDDTGSPTMQHRNVFRSLVMGMRSIDFS